MQTKEERLEALQREYEFRRRELDLEYALRPFVPGTPEQFVATNTCPQFVYKTRTVGDVLDLLAGVKLAAVTARFSLYALSVAPEGLHDRMCASNALLWTVDSAIEIVQHGNSDFSRVFRGFDVKAWLETEGLGAIRLTFRVEQPPESWRVQKKREGRSGYWHLVCPAALRSAPQMQHWNDTNIPCSSAYHVSFYFSGAEMLRVAFEEV